MSGLGNNPQLKSPDYYTAVTEYLDSIEEKGSYTSEEKTTTPKILAALYQGTGTRKTISSSQKLWENTKKLFEVEEASHNITTIPNYTNTYQGVKVLK